MNKGQIGKEEPGNVFVKSSIFHNFSSSIGVDNFDSNHYGHSISLLLVRGLY